MSLSADAVVLYAAVAAAPIFNRVKMCGVEARQRKAKKRQPTRVMAIKQDVQVRYCQHWVISFFSSVENRDFCYREPQLP